MTTLIRPIRRLMTALCFGMALAAPCHQAAAGDLGIEGSVYEPIEEDFRLTIMRLLARQDWSVSTDELQESAKDYTKNLPAYYLPRASETKTRWKDVGIVVTEDVYLPWVDWKTGSVFEPSKKLAVPAGTYLNPLNNLPSRAIERLFVFDATDPDQLSFAKELMKKNIPQLSFMLIAGDLGPLAEEMNRPIYHAIPQMLEKFKIEALPTLIGFGKGIHKGHMALTEFKLPTEAKTVESAWFGLPYPGYNPEDILEDSVTEPAVPAVASEPVAAEPNATQPAAANEQQTQTEATP